MDTENRTADVLLVDDDELVLHMVRRRLRGTNIVLHTCKTAHEAYQFLTEHSVRLILLDQRLPDQSGDVLLEQLVAEDRLNNAKAFVCTFVQPQQETGSRIEQLGAHILLKETILQKDGLLNLFNNQMAA